MHIHTPCCLLLSWYEVQANHCVWWEPQMCGGCGQEEPRPPPAPPQMRTCTARGWLGQWLQGCQELVAENHSDHNTRFYWNLWYFLPKGNGIIAILGMHLHYVEMYIRGGIDILPAGFSCCILVSSSVGISCCQLINSTRSWYLTLPSTARSPPDSLLHHLTSRDNWSAVSGRLYWKQTSHTCSAPSSPADSYSQ